MPDTVFGLPVHALVLHAAVTLVPLAALCLVAIAVYPRWRDRFGVPVVLLTASAMVVVFVVQESGEHLRTLMGYDPATFRHGQIADTTLWWIFPMFLTSLALVLLSRRQRREDLSQARRGGATRLSRQAGQGAVVLVVAVLAVAAAGAGTVQVIRAGHSGAESVWQGRVPPQQ
jgi:hypothetical protein